MTRCIGLLEGGQNPLAIPLPPGGPRGIDHEENDIGLGERLEGGPQHGTLKEVTSLENPRRIQEDDLIGIEGQDARDPLPRRLCLGGDDREVFPDQMVEERRFARVGPPNEGNVAGTPRCRLDRVHGRGQGDSASRVGWSWVDRAPREANPRAEADAIRCGPGVICASRV